MKNTIYKVSKTNLIGAVCLTCFAAILSNTAFNFLACLVTNDTAAGIANNLIDVVQLAAYVSVKLARFKRLDRYDLPFVIGGVVAIVM